MTESVSLVGLVVALCLPWACGALWVRAVLREGGSSGNLLALGHGYFVGMFLVTLLLRLWDGIGLGLDFWSIAGLLLVLALPPVLLVMKSASVVSVGDGFPLPAWQRVLVGILLALLAYRYAGLAWELCSRPLFAWDAFMNWAPKAVVWFHLGELAPFVSPDDWFKYDSAYTLGNERASLYPPTVSLIQLWHMLGAGTWDSGSVYIAWIAAPLALGAALYAHLRRAGVGLLLAVAGVYGLLSLPYLNVHAVLAGYADLWLAAVFGLAVCALYEWRSHRRPVWVILWVLLAVLCMQLKNPGLIIGAVVLVAGVLGSLAARTRLWLVLAAVALLLCLMAIGIELHLPYLGKFVLDTWVIEVGRYGKFQLQYFPVGEAFFESFFTMINWHLLGYIAPPVFLYGLYREGGLRVPEAEWLALLGAVLFILLVFVFTKHHKLALNFVTLNRVLLYLVPALFFCLVLTFREEREEAFDSS